MNEDTLSCRQYEGGMGLARESAERVIESVPWPLVVLDWKFRICHSNEAFRELGGFESGVQRGRLLTQVAAGLLGQTARLCEELETLRNSNDRRAGFSFEQRTVTEGARTLCIRGRRLPPAGEGHLLVTFEDITTQRETELQLASATMTFQRIQEEERRRIARELHDDVTQRLVSMDLDLGALEEMISKTAQAKLHEVRNRLARLAGDVSRLAHHLHLGIVEDLGLVAALRTIVQEFDRHGQITATFSSTNVPESIPLEASTTLYRIAQEALRNAVKHAGRTEVKVQLRGVANAVELEVADAGGGFDAAGWRRGLGLVSMEERLRILGGALQITSAAGLGTQVIARLPVPFDGSHL